MSTSASQDPRSARSWSRLRGVTTAALVAALVVAISAAALRTPSSVGHWIDADGQDAYDAAYEAAFADLPEPAAVVDVRTEFGFVRTYRFSATGPDAGEVPIMLLPGTASGTPVWAANLPSLLQLGDVIALDLLGEPGMSVQSRPITSAADQAAWLHEVIEALPEREVHLLGLSIGGWTAANLAVREPEGIASMTLLDPVMVIDDMPIEMIVRSIPASIPWLPRSLRDGFNSWVAGGATVDGVAVADMIEAGMQHYAMAQPGPTRITPEQLEELTVPTLAIVAGQSVIHDTDTAVATAESAFGADHVVLYPDATHAINGEYADDIAADMSAFLASLP